MSTNTVQAPHSTVLSDIDAGGRLLHCAGPFACASTLMGGRSGKNFSPKLAGMLAVPSWPVGASRGCVSVNPYNPAAPRASYMGYAPVTVRNLGYAGAVAPYGSH